mmetsp:Transcript_7087/g.25997  ORF Transcript_7087/g.25997 Transcript_7087/m.25997 type:complete len:125 (-) Transcript_7087:167-541(-)
MSMGWTNGSLVSPVMTAHYGYAEEPWHKQFSAKELMYLLNFQTFFLTFRVLIMIAVSVGACPFFVRVQEAVRALAADEHYIASSWVGGAVVYSALFAPTVVVLIISVMALIDTFDHSAKKRHRG